MSLAPDRLATPPNASVAVALLMALALAACGGDELPPGEIEGPARPEAVTRATEAAQDAARATIQAGAEVRSEARILFGDLHVHTSYSIDSFVFQLPLFGGEGAHPPADACDFARYCSGLDFFSLNDHAEGMTPERWEMSKDSIRQCNALGGDPADPDLVAFIGWEWTQAGTTPEDHYGHKNIIFPGLGDDEVPARPITSLPDDTMDRAPGTAMKVVRVLEKLPGLGFSGYADFLWWVERLSRVPDCPAGVDTRQLPPDCRENAGSPDVLFEKLDQWGFPTLVIPHGLAWGIHAPPRSSIRPQLSRANHDPERQRLLEVFSGHGNSEAWRRFTEPSQDPEAPFCPEPTGDYLPCCWRAGEIMRERCGDLPEAECQARVEEARRLGALAGTDPHLVFPDTRPEDWLDCDQCRDCFKPAMNLRPKLSAQYALALSNPDEPDAGGDPLRFRFGLIASTDNHNARAGAGYKEVERKAMTDARGIPSRWMDSLTRSRIMGEQADRQRAQPPERPARSLRQLVDTERTASFLYPGGLVAVHAPDRTRGAIWDALMARRVYGTSGPRILLWFDLLNGPDGRTPMGSEVALSEPPRFEVRAVGAFQQIPGCPEHSLQGLSADRLEDLCRSECHNPGEARHPITAIEVVRIRPQRDPDEPMALLIEDPWRRFDCAPDPAGCRITFEDPAWPRAGRDAVYYVRALQEPTPAINGANLRTGFDADGNPVATTPCHANWLGDPDDDCLAPVQERAWSSPIFVDAR